ncbi:hypothetical protein [Bacillus taeanensis]|nr:hypothetical protein [Bacillus taeanensis]
MYQSHGVCYAQYSRCLQTRMRVEEARQRDYLQSLALVQNQDQKIVG